MVGPLRQTEPVPVGLVNEYGDNAVKDDSALALAAWARTQCTASFRLAHRVDDRTETAQSTSESNAPEAATLDDGSPSSSYAAGPDRQRNTTSRPELLVNLSRQIADAGSIFSASTSPFRGSHAHARGSPRFLGRQVERRLFLDDRGLVSRVLGARSATAVAARTRTRRRAAPADSRGSRPGRGRRRRSRLTSSARSRLPRGPPARVRRRAAGRC